MANVIKPKRSNTAAAVPTTGQITGGEMAVNMADRKIWINNGSTVVQIGAGNLSALGDVSVSSPGNGEVLKYNTSTSKWENGGVVASTATNISGGTANQIPYQTGASTTSFITAPTTTDTYLKWTGSAFSWATAGSGTGLLPWSLKTANYTAVTLDRIIADTSGGSFTITLPASPTTGMSVEITDGGNWSVNNLTIARNGSTIEGSTNDVVFNIGNITVIFIYTGTTWQVVATLGAQGPQGPQGIQGPAGTVLASPLTSGTGIQYDSGNTFTGEFAKTISLTNNQRIRTINFIVDGAGSPIATGVKGDIVVDFAGTITSWTLLGNNIGTISVAVSKSTYSTYPTFTASGGNIPFIDSTAQKGSSAINWTGFTTVSSGDILRFTVPTVPSTAVTRATLSLSILLS